MATLNLSTNGPSISKSYQTVVQSPRPSGPPANSPTYGQWAVYSVSTPLANVFQQTASSKESVLKVQSTGDGELVDLINDFSDGRVQFAYVKVKDPNTGLPKNVLIGWCGEGVPERTKGYFTSYLAAVGQTLHGAHVQITARSESDLTPDIILRKVAESSGANYGGAPALVSSGAGAPPPALASKPAFNPTRSPAAGGTSRFNPLAGNRSTPVDQDGWGDDAPPVTRTQLEKVQPAYQPTKVNMNDLTAQKDESTRFNGASDETARSDVIKGGYQPIKKVDIAALRRQAQESGSTHDERPTVVKGVYEPIGKVDIASIRARAQPPTEAKRDDQLPPPPPPPATPDHGPTSTMSNRSERLTSLPRPNVSSIFSSSTSAFRGTKPPAPAGYEFGPAPSPAAPPVGAAGRTFADQGGKTPAQLWAEKKAKQRSTDDGGAPVGNATPSIGAQKSGGEWKSGYAGKTWAPVQTTRTGQSAGSGEEHDVDHREGEEGATAASGLPAGGIGAIRDRFKGQAGAVGLPIRPRPETQDGHPPPPPSPPAPPSHEDDHRMPSPPAVPRSPTPPTPAPMTANSPIRLAMPVSKSHATELEAPEERFSPVPIPTESTARALPAEEELTDERVEPDAARAAAEATAAVTFGESAVAAAAHPGTQDESRSDGPPGKRALIQYDYEKAEGNEIDLVEGEYVTKIEMVDTDWWMGQNSKGEMGLFPSNYVELVNDGHGHGHDDELGAGDGGTEQGSTHENVQADRLATTHPITTASETALTPATAEETGVGESATTTTAATTTTHQGPTATALYDYAAAEPNELTFAEGSKITGVQFPDEDWWFGHQDGREGLFPANYVQLDD